MSYQITVQTGRGPIALKFSNIDLFAKVAGMQVGILHGSVVDPDEFCGLHGRDLTRRWSEREQLGLFQLRAGARILDIGAGVGLLDLCLLKYLDDSDAHFYLLDRGRENSRWPTGHWSADHGFYNDWDVFFDLTECSGIDRGRFTLLSPEDAWPERLDLIMSSHSYLWHYPKDIYWPRILPHAKAGCQMGFDILNRDGVDYVAEISRETGRSPRISPRPMPLFHWYKEELFEVDGSIGRVCVWPSSP